LSERATCTGAETDFNPVLTCVGDDSHFLDGVGPSEVDAVIQLAVVLAETLDHAALVGIDADRESEIADGGRDDEENQKRAENPDAPRHGLAKLILAAPEDFLKVGLLAAA
jgi:hypothetical protein